MAELLRKFERTSLWPSSLVASCRPDFSKLCAIYPRAVALELSQNRPGPPDVLSSRCSPPESAPFDSCEVRT